MNWNISILINFFDHHHSSLMAPEDHGYKGEMHKCAARWPTVWHHDGFHVPHWSLWRDRWGGVGDRSVDVPEVPRHLQLLLLSVWMNTHTPPHTHTREREREREQREKERESKHVQHTSTHHTPHTDTERAESRDNKHVERTESWEQSCAIHTPHKHIHTREREREKERAESRRDVWVSHRP